MIEITVNNVISEMKNLKETRGDYIYERDGLSPLKDSMTCHNVHSDGEGNLSAGCIVGTVLANLGVPLEAMYGTHNTTGDSILVSERHRYDVGDLTSALIADGTIRITDDAVVTLREAQIKQDTGHTWAESVDGAIEYYGKWIAG